MLVLVTLPLRLANHNSNLYRSYIVFYVLWPGPAVYEPVNTFGFNSKRATFASLIKSLTKSLLLNFNV